VESDREQQICSLIKTIREQKRNQKKESKITEEKHPKKSEKWGCEHIKIIEHVHLQYCKRILKVRTTTPNFMVHRELGGGGGRFF